VTGIPYETFPTIEIGPLTIRVFGLMVALGMIIGIIVAARRNERFGVPRGETERVGFWLVVVGLLGARLAWVLTNLERIDSPIDIIAVWEGGLQFTGGFIAAALLAPVLTRSWPKGQRWVFLDGAVLGLAIGQMIGRIGCYAVGEHLGGETDFFLGVTYRGGDTIEGPLEVGVTYHNTALYEFLWLIPIIVILLLLDRRGVRPGIMTGTFAVLYGTMRFITDFFRTFDTTFGGLTGAQYASMALVVVGIAILATTSRRADHPMTEDAEAEVSPTDD
jgi:phosphatidylglycerol:prolipoprotein diacylglycerol transferase